MIANKARRCGAVAGMLLAATAAPAANPDAIAFGAREGAEEAALSPDGTKVAFLAPNAGQGSTLFTVSVDDPAAEPKAALMTSGAPDRLRDCRWVSNTRLVCRVWGKVKVPEEIVPLTYSRLIGVDTNGANQKMLTTRQLNARENSAYGGDIIDWLPGSDGEVLLLRLQSRTDQVATLVGSRREGLTVERFDTRSLKGQTVEPPRPQVIEYITDGQGQVRIAGFRKIAGETGQITGVISYRFRPPASRDWQVLGDYDAVKQEGFDPYTVDPERNVVYGFRKVDGRLALYTKALDGSGTETAILSRPDVDVDGLIRIGRKRRVVGASYATDRREAVYFDLELKALIATLGRALPHAPQINIVDASADENRLLIFAGSDTDPGTYYMFDKNTKKLRILLQKRPQIAGRTLAAMQPVTLRARDGTAIPAYLTLPPGGGAKGLPAIVMPHGGPAARDEWGFDWLPQYFAARGYAVLQPNFRGSEGYGDSFQLDNGFRSWRTSIGDVTDAGRWLVAQGIADPARLAIVGWSYGGYAALQSAVVEPTLFKAVVAIAAVTDFAATKEERRNWANYRVISDFIGPAARDASPAQNAAAIKAPVLLAHGTLDSNVGYAQSTLMESRLAAAGARVGLLTFPGLDHYLADGAARAELLDRSDAFLRDAFSGAYAASPVVPRGDQ
jgi:dienelactone hydrolase